MALGVPVVVSRTRVDDHYFNDQVVQFFEPEDERDLAGCLLLMARDRGLRCQLAANARRFVEDYSWERNKGSYLNLVDGLLEQRTRQAGSPV